jgi:AcrR family transcriptional regulator
MKEKPFDKIQIKEITNRASLSRPTFYMHYESKLDLLGDYFDTVFYGYSEDLKKTSAEGAVESRMVPAVAFRHWQNQQEIVDLLKQSGLEFLLMRRVREHVVWLINFMAEERLILIPSEGISQYTFDFVAGGVFLILLRWMEEGCTSTPEEMADMVLDYLGGLKGLQEGAGAGE